MRKENPVYWSDHPDAEVKCKDCPFTDERGYDIDHLCEQFHPTECPTRATYKKACEFADSHQTKGGE